ncbi:50S ribosomal protein L30 [Nitrosomonas sp. sh817]|uniref:50S ribosomal protein L30 n=1 Tax=Nitrosomonas sp. sh817 TaxID=3070658 RepID=UPI0027DB0ACA|nr:50S ribosomal protein L30 [Nitrosomonas sp. sh817]WMJ08058.1 50S ribosomal protein L30 [Nitrosomonas sp. sh817]
MTNNKTIKITLIKSTIGTKKIHRETIKGLGLSKINSYSILNDTPSIRGMINKVFYLVKCD